jgi:hypothetical protein
VNTLPERIDNLDIFIANDMKACMKKPIPIKATQMFAEFRVQTLEGDYKQGKPGDYLMCGIEGELYICDKDIFEKTYDFLKSRDSLEGFQ